MFFSKCELRTNLHFRTLCLFQVDLERPGPPRRMTARPFPECFGKKEARETLGETMIPASGSIDSYLWDRSHIKLS